MLANNRHNLHAHIHIPDIPYFCSILNIYIKLILLYYIDGGGR